MPKTPITAKFIRVPVEGGRLPVAPAFDDFLDAKHMVVVELGMQKGNLLPEYFDAEKSAKMVEEINAFNAACRKAGIPIVHAGYKFRKGGLDLVNAQYPRITPLSGKKPFPNPAMEEDPISGSLPPRSPRETTSSSPPSATAPLRGRTLNSFSKSSAAKPLSSWALGSTASVWARAFTA